MTDKLDFKDVEILKALRKDSRTPLGIIAKEIGISKATVSRRVAKMEADGLITKYSMGLDHAKLGIFKCFVSLQIVGSPVVVVTDQLKQYDEIRNIYKSFGDHNVICEMYCNTIEEIYETVQSKIMKMPSVKYVEVDILIEDMRLDENADLKLYAKREALKE